MRIAIIADTHSGIRGNSEHFIRLQENFWTKVFWPAIDEHKCEHIIHLGDFFDNRKGLCQTVMESVYQTFLVPFMDRSIPMDLIIGNHDTFYKNTNRLNSPDLMFRNVPDIKLHVDRVDVDTFDGVDIGFVPWICDDNREKIFRQLEKLDVDLLCGHFEFSGFAMYKGQLATHGLDPNVLKQFKQILSGHYHYESKSGNVHYIGSPHWATWADYGDSRGFYIFDTNDRSMTKIENTEEIFVKLIYNNGFGKAYKNLDFSDCTNKYVQLVVKNRESASKFETDLQKLEASLPIDLQIVDETTMDTTLTNSIEDSEVGSKDTFQVVDEYVEEVENLTTKQKDGLTRLMKDLYREAIEQRV